MAKECECRGLLKNLKEFITNLDSQEKLRSSKKEGYLFNTLVKEQILEEIDGESFYLKACPLDCNHYQILLQITKVIENYNNARVKLRGRAKYRKNVIQNTFLKIQKKLYLK